MQVWQLQEPPCNNSLQPFTKPLTIASKLSNFDVCGGPGNTSENGLTSVFSKNVSNNNWFLSPFTVLCNALENNEILTYLLCICNLTAGY